jgi:hypothetical protein
MKLFALPLRLRVGEVGAGLGKGDDTTVCEVVDDKDRVENIECT